MKAVFTEQDLYGQLEGYPLDIANLMLERFKAHVDRLFGLHDYWKEASVRDGMLQEYGVSIIRTDLTPEGVEFWHLVGESKFDEARQLLRPSLNALTWE